ncbi:MAG: DUF4388 domain-containing protein, partial [Deltaproteobacteria bacterium]|nr:DUF4388 domain-containing protein [Deltaproteobacteria bacterium]
MRSASGQAVDSMMPPGAEKPLLPASSMDKAKPHRELLLIDGDGEWAAALAQPLEAAEPCLTLLVAADMRSAETILDQRRVDVVFADHATLGDEPLHLLYYLRGRYPLVQLVATTSASALPPEIAQPLETARIAVLHKPYTAQQAVELIRKSLEQRASFVGTVADFELIDTLQLLHMGRHSRHLHISGHHGDGELIFRRGQLVHARVGEREGVDAFLDMVSWTSGVIRSAPARDDAPTTITSNWVHLAMEGLRRLDEQRHREKLAASAGAKATPVSVTLRTLSPAPAVEESDDFLSEEETGRPLGDPLVDTLLQGRYHVGVLLETTPLLRRYQAEMGPKSQPVWVDVLDDRLVSPLQEGKREAIAEWALHYRSLSHPALQRLLDHGEVVLEGRPFFFLVSEPALGRPLSQLLGEPLSPEDAIALIRQLAQPLRLAHQHGLFHGNLHPGCVFLHEPEGPSLLSRKEPVLTLVGTGLLPALELSRDQGFEQPWAIFGAPLYLAPEQISNDAIPGPRSDLYALGVLLHQLLTGQSPLRQATLSSLLAAKLGGKEPRLSLPLPEPLRSRMELLVQRCLSRDAQHRPRSVDELIQILDASLLGEPQPPGPEELRIATPAGTPPVQPQGSEAVRPRHGSSFVEQRLSTPFAAVGIPAQQRRRRRS